MLKVDSLKLIMPVASGGFKRSRDISHNAVKSQNPDPEVGTGKLFFVNICPSGLATCP